MHRITHAAVAVALSFTPLLILGFSAQEMHDDIRKFPIAHSISLMHVPLSVIFTLHRTLNMQMFASRLQGHN